MEISNLWERIIRRVHWTLRRRHCGNCRYGTPIYIEKGVYNQHIHVYKRSGKKKIKKELIGFKKYTSVNCNHPKTQNRWAPYLRNMDFLMMTKPFKCCYWKRKENSK